VRNLASVLDPSGREVAAFQNGASYLKSQKFGNADTARIWCSLVYAAVKIIGSFGPLKSISTWENLLNHQ